MAPTTPKTEADIADAVEQWLEQIRSLEAMGPRFNLPLEFRKTALGSLMQVGSAKQYYESIVISEPDFDIVLNKCKEFAMRRRLEHNQKRNKDDMELDEVEEDSMWAPEMGGGYWEWSLNGQDGGWSNPMD